MGRVQLQGQKNYPKCKWDICGQPERKYKEYFGNKTVFGKEQ